MTWVAGADVWKGRWVVVVLLDGWFRSAFVRPTVTEIIHELGDFSALALDIPIGLPLGKTHRACDVRAKMYVGERSSSVFHTPPRAVLEAPTYREANRLSKDFCGRGVSAQAYALRAKILEVDPVASADLRLFEVHPEVSFRAMKGRSLAFSKKSWNGQMERRDLVRSQGIDLPGHLEDAGIAAADDLLDAAAAAWSAWRVHLGLAKTLPPLEESNSNERHSKIWY